MNFFELLTFKNGKFGDVKVVKTTTNEYLVAKTIKNKTAYEKEKEVSKIKNFNLKFCILNYDFIYIQIMQTIGHSKSSKYVIWLISSNDNENLLLLPLMLGGNLEEFIEASQKDKIIRYLRNVKVIASQIASGLDFIHSTLEILHNDLTPKNILLDKFGNCVISDFGISLRVNEKHTKMLTSIKYRAPEVHENVRMNFKCT